MVTFTSQPGQQSSAAKEEEGEDGSTGRQAKVSQANCNSGAISVRLMRYFEWNALTLTTANDLLSIVKRLVSDTSQDFLTPK